jgi:hypothetical protein
MRNSFVAALLILYALGTAPGHAQARNDDDRSASRTVHSAPARAPVSPLKEIRNTKRQSEPRPAPTANNKDMTRAESFGPLKTVKDGGLGIDMWDGSDRHAIITLLPQTPDSFTYRSMAALVRRVLLTNADVTMLDHKDGVDPGHDLLSLRIQKLMSMGALDAAAALYKDNPVEPVNAQMAAIGITAILYSGQTSLACLETNALKDRFAENPFWKEIGNFCDYLLAKMAGTNTGQTYASESPLISHMMAKNDFRYAIKSTKDLEALTPFEKAVLAADHRMDYGQIKKLDIDSLSPLTLALLAHDSDAPLDFRFTLILTAVRQGILTGNDLASFYKSAISASEALATTSDKLADIGSHQGWRQIAWLYKSTNAAHGQIDRAALQAALPLRKEYGLTALWPFASLMANANPDGFSEESIRSGVLLGLVTGSPVSKAWVNQWKKMANSGKDDILMKIAFAVRTNSPLETDVDKTNFQNYINGLDVKQRRLIEMLMEKLDKGQKLHNIETTETYDNLTDLTMPDGYVMQYGSLVDNLKKAVKDRRLAEVILLSSVLLHGVPPAYMSAGLLRETLDGFGTVGLNKETRDIATEAVLGLGK